MTVAEDLTGADIVVAVKEIPIDLLQAKKVYLFFSHTIKGQDYNMPMLQRLLDLGRHPHRLRADRRRTEPAADLLQPPRRLRGHDREPGLPGRAPANTRAYARPCWKSSTPTSTPA